MAISDDCLDWHLQDNLLLLLRIFCSQVGCSKARSGLVVASPLVAPALPEKEKRRRDSGTPSMQPRPPAAAKIFLEDPFGYFISGYILSEIRKNFSFCLLRRGKYALSRGHESEIFGAIVYIFLGLLEPYFISNFLERKRF